MYVGHWSLIERIWSAVSRSSEINAPIVSGKVVTEKIRLQIPPVFLCMELALRRADVASR